jgi:hypothetical protein
MKNFLRFYMVLCTGVCLWLTTAAFSGWKAPNFGILDGGGGSGGGGRSSYGFWGGGK